MKPIKYRLSDAGPRIGVTLHKKEPGMKGGEE